jgi:hypothetical protein
MKAKVWVCIVSLMATMTIAACHKEEGPMEKAGQKIDDAASEMKDAAKDAAEEVDKAVEGEH